MVKEPNPGSDEAIKAGCTCPVLDNNHGRGFCNGLFYINQGCPIHGNPHKEETGVLSDRNYT